MNPLPTIQIIMESLGRKSKRIHCSFVVLFITALGYDKYSCTYVEHRARRRERLLRRAVKGFCWTSFSLYQSTLGINFLKEVSKANAILIKSRRYTEADANSRYIFSQRNLYFPNLKLLNTVLHGGDKSYFKYMCRICKFTKLWEFWFR